MKESSFTKRVLAGALVLLVPFGIYNYIGDPFFYFHKPNFALTALTWEYPLYQNVGAAGTFSYEAAIIGSSTSTGFNPTWFESINGVNTIQLSVSGSRPYDNLYLMEHILNSGNKVKEIYYGFDCFHIQTSPDSTLFEYSGLLDPNLLTRYGSYLLSLEMTIKYTSQVDFTSKPQTLDDYNKAYEDTFSGSSDSNLYGLDKVLSSYTRKEPRSLSEEADGIVANARINAMNLVDIARRYPDTSFVIYIMPASMVYWDSVNQHEEIAHFIEGLSVFFETCLQVTNIQVHCFVDDIEMSTAYEYYADYIHHSPDLDKWVVERIFDGLDQITDDNYEARLASFRTFLLTFDYDDLVMSEKD